MHNAHQQPTKPRVAPDNDSGVVFVPYEKAQQAALLKTDQRSGSSDERAWPLLSDPGLVLDPSSVAEDSDNSARKDEWDVTPTSKRGFVCPGRSALKRFGWRHCCCIASILLLVLVATVLGLYLRLAGEPQFGLPPPPPGLIRPPSVPPAPMLAEQQLSYLGIEWAGPPGDSGGAAVLNFIVETAAVADGPFTVAATLVSSARYWGLDGLGGSTTVCFRLSAANNAGRGNATEPACFDTLAPTTPLPPLSVFPVGAVTTTTTIGVGWSDGNGSGLPVLGYTLQFCDEVASGEAACAAGDAAAYAQAYSGADLTHTSGGHTADSRLWWRVATETALGASGFAPEPPLRLRTDAAGATAPLQP